MNAYSTDQIRSTAKPTITPIPSGLLQRCTATTECSDCRKKREGTLQRAAINPSSVEVPPIVHEVLHSPGQPLDANTRAFMEPRFGHDFSQVRVHTDTTAAESALAVNALAYTVGRDVVFGAGRYAPDTTGGQRLLAHELTHTIQQAQDSSAVAQMASTLQVSNPNDNYEREAETQAARVVAGQAIAPTLMQGRHGSARLQRQADMSQAPPGLSCVLTTGSGHLPGTDILFGLSSSALTASGRAEIAAFVRAWIASGSRDDVMVDGWASVDGPQPLNWRLSCERAEAVKTELAARGVPRAKVTTLAHGESTEFSTSDLSKNRRAIITLQPAAGPSPTPPTPIPTPTPTPPTPSTPTPTPPTPAPILPVLRFWINAFIPNTLSGAFRAPAGPFAGRQVFRGPPAPFHFNSCFETDERGFTSTLPVSSRLHVNAEFDTASRRLTARSGVSGGFTFEIDCTTGATKCTSPVTPRGSGVNLVPPIMPSSNRFDILIAAFANDPCVTGSPDLAIRGDIGIDPVARTFSFTIFTTLFPAMEMYLSVGGGSPTILFMMPPAASSVGLLFIPGISPHSGSGRF